MSVREIPGPNFTIQINGSNSETEGGGILDSLARRALRENATSRPLHIRKKEWENLTRKITQEMQNELSSNTCIVLFALGIVLVTGLYFAL